MLGRRGRAPLKLRVRAQDAITASPTFGSTTHGRAGDVNHAIEVGIHHRLGPLRAQLLERPCSNWHVSYTEKDKATTRRDSSGRAATRQNDVGPICSRGTF